MTPIYIPGHIQRVAKDLAEIRAIYAKYEHATDPQGRLLHNQAGAAIARLESEHDSAVAQFTALFDHPLSLN